MAYYEHAQAAGRLGALLVTPADLLPDGDALGVRLASGESQAVDIVYRRTDEDRICNQRDELTDVARALLEP